MNGDVRLPPWLRGVPLPARPLSRQMPPTDDLPDWLNQEQSAELPAGAAPLPAGDLAGEGGDAAIPGWLRELQSDIEGGEEDPFLVDDDPDWLSSLSAEMPAAELPSASPSPGESAGIPDWLRDEVAPSEVTDDPAPEPVPPPPDSPPPRVRIRMPQGATDWLRSLDLIEEGDELVDKTEVFRSDTPSSSVQASEVDAAIPDWLRDISPEEMAHDIEASSPAAPTEPAGTLPPWLADAPASAELPPEADAAIPDWLRDISPEEMAHDIETSSPAAPTEPTEPARTLPPWLAGTQSLADKSAAADESIPDWLRNISSLDQPEASEEPTVDQSGAALPAWLQDDSFRLSDVPSTGEEAAEDNAPDVPAWLQSPQGDQHPLTDAPIPAPAADDDETAQGVPAWLQSLDKQSIPFEADPDTMLESVETPEGDIPAWLRSSDDQPPSSRRDAPEDDATEMPSWLQDVQPDERNKVTPADEEVHESRIPGWLQTGPETDIPEEPAADKLPDWLRSDMPERSDLPPPGRSDVIEANDLPAWLTDSDVATPDQADQPDWLQDREPESAQAEPDVPSSSDKLDWLQDAAPASDQPEWLRDQGIEPPALETDRGALPPWMTDESDSPISSADTAGEAGLPDWLRGADADVQEVKPPVSPVTPVVPPDDTLDDTDVPIWMRDVVPEPVQRDETTGRMPAGTSESSNFFDSTDLPEWLYPSEPSTRPIEESPSANLLARLGIQEDDGGEGMAVAPSAALLLPRPVFPRSPARIEAATLLQSLIAQPYPQIQAPVLSRQASIWERIGAERILSILLLVAVLTGLLFPQLTSFLGIHALPSPQTEELVAYIDTLSADNVTMVAYEWDAQRSSELRPLEQAVMQHLIDNKVGMVVMSTDPQGTLLSFDLRDQLQAGGYQGKGVDYILLGYRPGGDLALRSMAQDFWATLQSDFNGNNATEGALATDLTTGEPRLETLNDLDLIVVMADQPQDVQGWIEQVHSAAADVRMLFLLPSETAPVVQPYLRSPGIDQLAGQQGALDYMLARDQTIGKQASGQQHFVVLAFVSLVIIGGVLGIFLHSPPRRKKEQTA